MCPSKFPFLARSPTPIASRSHVRLTKSVAPFRFCPSLIVTLSTCFLCFLSCSNERATFVSTKIRHEAEPVVSSRARSVCQRSQGDCADHNGDCGSRAPSATRAGSLLTVLFALTPSQRLYHTELDSSKYLFDSWPSYREVGFTAGRRRPSHLVLCESG